MSACCRNCPVCDLPPSRADLIGYFHAGHTRFEGHEFALTYCACGELVYLSPAPRDSDIRAMYSESSQFDQKEVYGAERGEEIIRFYQGCLRRILRQMRRREDAAIKVLEVGAGLAWVSRAAKSVNPGSLTIAQDLSSEAAQSCGWVDHYHVADFLTCGRIEETAPYDVVSLTHVIEHLVDPVSVLKRVCRLVSPGGLVFITAPHRPKGWHRGRDVKIWQEWSYAHVPGHTQYFSHDSLEKAAGLAGLGVLFWDSQQEEGQAFEAWLRPEPSSDVQPSMLGDSLRERVSEYRNGFLNAAPFRHVVIDGFLAQEAAEQMLRDFPAFQPENARNEFGAVGTKATIADISRISAFYAEVYRFLGTPEFLDLVTRITNIPDLVHDEQMFGGGTHENLEGDELDPHVDFNYIEDRKLHRRLNLLLYLNTEWENSWGGALELHSNPRRPAENQIKTIQPLFNRCVIFETNEFSWHGFERIRLPPEKKNISRKLLSVYLYTHDRPEKEIAPPHGTFYVQRAIPKQLTCGHTLTEDDLRELSALLVRRDDWIEYYQTKELADSGRLQELKVLRERMAMLQAEFDERGRWALSLDKEILDLRAHIARLQEEVRSPNRLLRRLGRKLRGMAGDA